MRSLVRRGLGIGCLSLFLFIMIGGAIAIIVDQCQDAAKEEDAEARLAEIAGLLATGDAAGASERYLATFRDFRRTDVLADDARLDAVLRQFSAADLAALSARALSELPTLVNPVDRGVSSGMRASALCDAAILGAYPAAPEAAAARERLVGLLGLTPGAPASVAQPAARATAIRGLSMVNDPAFIAAMDALVVSAELSRWDAARVLAGMDPYGLSLLRDRFGSGDAELRRVLAEALSYGASGTTPELVRTALESADGLVRLDGAAAAAAALSNEESPWQDVAASLLEPYAADPYVTIGAPVYFIRQGKDESVQALIDGLDLAGDVRSAESLLNSGKDELRDAAAAWARQNGYTIEEKPGSSGVEWGKD